MLLSVVEMKVMKIPVRNWVGGRRKSVWSSDLESVKREKVSEWVSEWEREFKNMWRKWGEGRKKRNQKRGYFTQPGKKVLKNVWCGRTRPFCFLWKKIFKGWAHQTLLFFTWNCCRIWCGRTYLFLEIFFVKGAGAPWGGARAPPSLVFFSKFFWKRCERTSKWYGRTVLNFRKILERCGRTLKRW